MATTTTSAILPTVQIDVNYLELKDSIKDFLSHFKGSSAQSTDMDMEDGISGPKYISLLQKIANREVSTLYIELDDLQAYQDYLTLSVNKNLVHHIVKNTHRFIEVFSQVADELMPEPTVDVSYKDDVLDVIIHQRKLRNARLQQDTADEYNHISQGFDLQTPQQQQQQLAAAVAASRRKVKICSPPS